MPLTDGEILVEIEQGSLKIENFDPDGLQPTSYDMLLGNSALLLGKSDGLYAEFGANLGDDRVVLKVGNNASGYLHLWKFR